MVAVPVGDVRLVGLRVDEDLGHLTEGPGVVAAAVRVTKAELLEEFAVLSELQHLTVVAPVAADPDVPFVVDGNAVVRLRPLEALARAAPRFKQVAGLIEL